MRETMFILAVGFALAGSMLSTSALALENSFGSGHRASGASQSSVDKFHRGVRENHGRRQKRDPWGHWGAYYGPMITAP